MDRNRQEMDAIELNRMESILASEEAIVPSSGFLNAVMERVQEESAMPAQIPFPWKRALPGFVLVAGFLGWGGIEFVRWGPIGRLGLIGMLPKLYDGSHISHPLASRCAVRRVEFDLATPVDVMIDGEIARVACRSIDIIPGAVDVYV